MKNIDKFYPNFFEDTIDSLVEYFTEYYSVSLPGNAEGSFKTPRKLQRPILVIALKVWAWKDLQRRLLHTNVS